MRQNVSKVMIGNNCKSSGDICGYLRRNKTTAKWKNKNKTIKNVFDACR